MPENDSPKVNPNEQDPYSPGALAALAAETLHAAFLKDEFENWEEEAEIFGGLAITFAPGEDVARVIEHLTATGDVVGEVRIIVKDKDSLPAKMAALEAAGFSVTDHTDRVVGFWSAGEPVPAGGVHQLLLGCLREFEDSASIPRDVVDLIITRYLRPYASVEIDRASVEYVLREVWRRDPGVKWSYRPWAVIRLFVGLGYIPTWKDLDRVAERREPLNPQPERILLGQILNEVAALG